MKPFILLTLFSIKLLLCNAQNIDTFTNFSKSLTMDTILTPDYFKTQITISEFYSYQDSKRFRNPSKTILDSVKNLLFLYLNKINSRPNIVLAIIEENINSRMWDKPVLLGTYTLNISCKDSVLLTLNYLLKNMPQLSLVGFRSEPFINSETINKANKSIENSCFIKAKNMAQKFADSNSLKVLKINAYNFGFFQKQEPYQYQIDPPKQFKLNFNPIIYNFYGAYSFKLN